METKLIGALEITSKAVKLVIGYVLDGYVIVVKALSTSLDEGAVEEGVVCDYNAVSKAIASTMKDANESLSTPLRDIAMVISPIGFEVYEHQQTTSIVSPVGKIAKLDIDNVFSQLSKAKTKEDSAIIDILPDVYVLDRGQQFFEAPLGQTSNSLTIRAKLHVVPNHLVNSYKKVFSQANLRPSKIIVAPYAALEVINQQKNVPNDFLIIDLGARITTINLVGRKQLLASTFIYRGVDHIGEKLADTFGIDVSGAQQLKEMFGFEEESYAFHAPLFSVVNKEKKERYTVNYDDWKEAVGSILHDYAHEIQISIQELAEQNDPKIVELPVMLVGGGTKFYGLASVLQGMLNSQDLRVINSTSLGARDAQYTNCVGAIKILGSIKPLEDEEVEDNVQSETSGEPRTRKIKTSRSFNDLDDEL